MAITAEQLQEAGTLVGAAGSLREAAASWRERHPQVRAVLVDALDMGDEVPALQLGERRIYLAASNGHCWHVTGTADEASALIFTQA